MLALCAAGSSAMPKLYRSKFGRLVKHSKGVDLLPQQTDEGRKGLCMVC